MAAALSRITPGFLSKLTTSLSSTWFRGANPSTNSQKLLGRGYSSDALLGIWVNEKKEKWQELGAQLGVSQNVMSRHDNCQYVVVYGKERETFIVYEQISNGPLLEYIAPPRQYYNRPMPLHDNIRLWCTRTDLDNGIREKCTVYQLYTGKELNVTSDRCVENDKLKEVVTCNGIRMVMEYIKM